MLHIRYTYGIIDSQFDINPSVISGTIAQSRINLAEFKAGRMATVGSDGFVRLATDGDIRIGVIVNDASGEELENVPAIASGKMPLVCGGGLVESDQIVEDNVVPGDKLYIGANGQFTKAPPSATSNAVGIARGSNSSGNKLLSIQL